MFASTRSALRSVTHRSALSRFAASALVAALLLPGVADAKPKKKAAPAAARPDAAAPAAPAGIAITPKASNGRPAGDPKQWIDNLAKRLDTLSQGAKGDGALHAQIGQALDELVDYAEMGRLALPKHFDTFTDAQKGEYLTLLRKMLHNTYVKRFKAGTTVKIVYQQVRQLSEGKVEVQTELTVKRTSADVHYAMHPGDGRWWVYDITVDDASQVGNYRKSFTKIMTKEGFEGLITRMTKAANKKPG